MAEIRGNYKPIEVPAKSWDYIEDQFEKIHQRDYSRMVELVQHIKESKLSDRLFAFTSVDVLIVSIYENIEKYREALHVRFDPTRKEWHFKYHAVMFKDPEFERTYPAEKGIEKFDQFVKMIRW